eukprot:TRINITY_DN6476_c0_g1_i2.p1 TRINITY_DN6476_c0_g1~~TRINITY_DN6476_c0_g1_i2.p1  ORF type:complete len:622 (+),score=105.05 TRINITY_DN6476_c0_g1_i2:28-1866(+)
MDRKAEILTMLKIPEIDFFIPSSPLSFDPLVDDMVNGRHWIIQGETLKFYMVIRLSNLLSNLEGSSKAEIVDQDAFVPRKWEGSSDSGDSTSTASETLDNSKTRAVVNSEILQSPTFRARLRELLSKLEINIEFMKGKSQSARTNNEDSPVSVDIRHVFQPSEDLLFHQKCFSLPNGDIVYPLTTDVSIKSQYVGHHISLAVAIYPPEPEMSISQLISPIYVERSAIRMVAVPVLVVEPVSPVITTNQVGSVMYASVSVTNNHTQAITLSDAHLNLYDVRKPDSPLSTFEYHNNYEIELYKDSFPIHLEPTEQYNFVTSIAAVASNLLDEDHSFSNTVPELHLKWHTRDLCGSMLSPMKIPFPKSEGKLLITFDTGEQPIKLHTIFPISLTVYNLSKQARDIILEIPLIKFEGQSERFFAEAPIADGSIQTTKSEKTEKPNKVTQETELDELEDRRRALYEKQIGETVEISVMSDNDSEAGDFVTPDDSPIRVNRNHEHSSEHASHGRKRSASFKYPITNQRLESWDKKVNIFEPPAATFRDYEESKQNVASVMCLEKVIYIGNIAANSQATTRIECVAMSQGLFTLKEVKAIDTISQKEFLVKEGCQIYIM